MNRDGEWIHDMLEHVELIARNPPKSKEAFMEDVVMQAAVTRWISILGRWISILGEAANRVSDDVRLANDDIDWRAIVDMRNLVVHAYGRVDPGIVWEVARDDVPALQPRLEAILAELE